MTTQRNDATPDDDDAERKEIAHKMDNHRNHFHNHSHNHNHEGPMCFKWSSKWKIGTNYHDTHDISDTTNEETSDSTQNEQRKANSEAVNEEMDEENARLDDTKQEATNAYVDDAFEARPRRRRCHGGWLKMRGEHSYPQKELEQTQETKKEPPLQGANADNVA